MGGSRPGTMISARAIGWLALAAIAVLFVPWARLLPEESAAADLGRSANRLGNAAVESGAEGSRAIAGAFNLNLTDQVRPNETFAGYTVVAVDGNRATLRAGRGPTRFRAPVPGTVSPSGSGVAFTSELLPGFEVRFYGAAIAANGRVKTRETIAQSDAAIAVEVFRRGQDGNWRSVALSQFTVYAFVLGAAT